MKIIGPSTAFVFSHPLKLVVFGDYHSPIEKDVVNKNTLANILSSISQSIPVHLYIEDVLDIGATTQMKQIYDAQKKENCNLNTCTKNTFHENNLNGTIIDKQSTLQGLKEFLFTCERDDNICPLHNGRVFRVDHRAQSLLKKSNGEVAQIVDDRYFSCKFSNFVQVLKDFVKFNNPQYTFLNSGISFPFLKSVTNHLIQLKKTYPNQYDSLASWWYNAVETIYPPWLKNGSFASSVSYNVAWNSSDIDSKKKLLHLIMTNAIMDLCCICTMLTNNVFDTNKINIVYAGCAHSELIADFFERFAPCTRAHENNFGLKVITKSVHIPQNIWNEVIRS